MKRIETTVDAGPYRLSIAHPPDPADLIDEEAFAANEYMPYWAEVWPSGIALAGAAAELLKPGDRAVELGCGLGIASIAAALSGAEVLATDWAADALEFTRENAARNGVVVETAVVSWEEPDALLARAPWDWVLAADVLYENRNVEPLAALVPRLGDRLLLADPGRPMAKSFYELLNWDTRVLGGGVRVLSRDP